MSRSGSTYTGRQHIEEDPFRTNGAAYLEANALGEIRVGQIGVFLNGINLTDVRQQRYEPIVLPQRTAVGEWTTEAWAPLRAPENRIKGRSRRTSSCDG